MTNPLIIVESQHKARTIKQQYDGELDFLIVQAPPIKVTCSHTGQGDDKQRFVFTPMPSERTVVDELVRNLDRDIYIALDSDERGECWAWVISEYLLLISKGAKTARRIHLLGIGRDELRESFKLVEPVMIERAKKFFFSNLLNSYLVKHIRRLLGTSNGPGNLPLGYTTLTILFLLADREGQIREYIRPPKWRVRVRLSGPDGEFDAWLVRAEGITEDGFLKGPSDCKQAVTLFKDIALRVQDIARTEMDVPAPIPYRLRELLHDSWIYLRMSPQKAFNAVQELFAGVKKDGAYTGLISTYHSMTATSLSPIIKKNEEYARQSFGADAMGEGGEPEESDEVFIFPLMPQVSSTDLDGETHGETSRLYELIRDRSLGGRMKDAEGEDIEVTLAAGSACLFVSSGRVITEQGFLAGCQNVRDRALLAASPLSGLTKDLELVTIQIVPEPVSDHLPEYYTIESLFTDLAEFSIRPDFFTVTILSRLIETGYLAMTPEGGIRCEENTFKVVNTMDRVLPGISGFSLSAYFVQILTELVSNRKTLEFALQSFEQTLIMRGKPLVRESLDQRLAKRIRGSERIIKAPSVPEITPLETPVSRTTPDLEAAEGAKSVVADFVPGKKTGEDAGMEAAASIPVPEETKQAISSDKEGEREVSFLKPDEAVDARDVEETAAIDVFDLAPPAEEITGKSTSAVDSLPDTKPAGQVREETLVTAIKCPGCGRPMTTKVDGFGKYWACSGFPACRHSESYAEPEEQKSTCPLCKNGKILNTRTTAGRDFFVCSERECDFMAWSFPHLIPCQICDSPYLVEKKTISGKPFLRCPRAGCRYQQPFPGDDGSGLLPPEGGQTVGPGKARRVVRRVVKGGGGKKRVVVRRK